MPLAAEEKSMSAKHLRSWLCAMAFAVAVVKKFGDDQAGNQVALLTYFAFVATPFHFCSP